MFANKSKQPLVSVITPSFNQAKYIRKTIESVLNQGYQNIEHIVVDGGSTDGTLEILKEFRSAFPNFKFISKKDRGQSHALNKGIRMARGEIIGWLNSDDTYRPGAINKAVDTLIKNTEWGMVYGKGYYINEFDQILSEYLVEPYNPKNLYLRCFICQPAAFIRREVLVNLNGLDESLDFCMDYDLWMRISMKYQIGYLDDYLANARVHPKAKSSLLWVDVGLPEIMKVSLKNYGSVSNRWILNYINNHKEKEHIEIIKNLQKYEIFGKSPQIKKLVRYDDLWVPPYFPITLQNYPENPIRIILIKGKNHHQFKKLKCMVYINGQFIKTYTIKNKNFTLEIPVFSNDRIVQAELITNRKKVPNRVSRSSDSRELSFIASEVIALSEKEYSFLNIIKKDMKRVKRWLEVNRIDNPFDKS